MMNSLFFPLLLPSPYLTCLDTGASSTPLYAYSPVGLFPCPLGPSTRFSIVEEVCSKFRFLGKFMAKAIMDSRMVSAQTGSASFRNFVNGGKILSVKIFGGQQIQQSKFIYLHTIS